MELRKALLQYPEAFRTALPEQLLLAAPGSGVQAAGTPETLIRARQNLRKAASPRSSDPIVAVVHTQG